MNILKAVPGYTNYYITPYGQIFKSIKPRLIELKPFIARGYKQIKLSKCHKRTTHGIHQLVARTFIPNPDNLPYVNHKDENKLNNNVINLEWCTASYNNNYGTGNQRRRYSLLVYNDRKHIRPLYKEWGFYD